MCIRDRIGHKVGVPAGICGSATLGGHRGILPVVLDPHQGHLAHLARPDAARGHDDHRHPAHRRAGRASGSFVELDLVADPACGAGSILTVAGHGTNSTPGAQLVTSLVEKRAQAASQNTSAYPAAVSRPRAVSYTHLRAHET